MVHGKILALTQLSLSLTRRSSRLRGFRITVVEVAAAQSQCCQYYVYNRADGQNLQVSWNSQSSDGGGDGNQGWSNGGGVVIERQWHWKLAALFPVWRHNSSKYWSHCQCLLHGKNDTRELQAIGLCNHLHLNQGIRAMKLQLFALFVIFLCC